VFFNPRLKTKYYSPTTIHYSLIVNAKSCQNCIYAVQPIGGARKGSGSKSLLICVNKADSPGRLYLVDSLIPCRNFFKRTKIPRPKKSLLAGPDVRFVPLSHGNFSIVDTDDYDHLSKYKWYTSQDGNHFYAYAYISIGNKKKKIFIHRYIMNAPKGLVVDHIDGNGLNNRKSNLRICTKAQNVQNCRPRSNCSSKYKGVFWNKANKKWSATIHKGDMRMYLGGFKKEIDAARAYDQTAAEFFGEFAYLNFGTHHVLPEKAGNGDRITK